MADEERDGTDDSFNKDTIMGLFSVGPDSFVDNAMSTVQRAAGEATSGTASAVFSSVDDVAGGIPNRAAAAVFSSVDDVTGGGEVVASYVRGLFTSTDDIQDDSSLAASPPLSPLSEDDISPSGGGDGHENEGSGQSVNNSSSRSKSSFDGSHGKSESRDRSWTPDSDLLRDDRPSGENWGQPTVTATPPSKPSPQPPAPVASAFAGSSLMARRKAAAAAAAASATTDAASAASVESPGDRAETTPVTTTTTEGSSPSQPSVKLKAPPKPSLAQLAKPQNDDTDGWTEQLAEQGVIRDITHNLQGEFHATSFDSGDEWPESGGEEVEDEDDIDNWRANTRAAPEVAPVDPAKSPPTLGLAARRGFQLGKPPVKAPAAAATPPPPVASAAKGPGAGSSLMARRTAAAATASTPPQVTSPPKLIVGSTSSGSSSSGGGGSSLAARRGFSLGGPPSAAAAAWTSPNSAANNSNSSGTAGGVAGGSSLAARRGFQLQKAPVSGAALGSGAVGGVAPLSGSSLAARRGFKLSQATVSATLTLGSSGTASSSFGGLSSSSSAATTSDSASKSTSLTPGSTPPRPLVIGGSMGGSATNNRFAARGLSLSIDTKAAAAANHGNAWAGVRLKNPQAARLRKTKEISSPDSPTVAKLLGAAKLGARGILLEVEQRRFAALAKELDRRGYNPPENTFQYVGDEAMVEVAGSSRRKGAGNKRINSNNSPSSGRGSGPSFGADAGPGMGASLHSPPSKQSAWARAWAAVRRASGRDRSLTSPSHGGHNKSGQEIQCTQELLQWVAEVYAGDTLNLAARDLVQAVVHVTSAEDTSGRLRQEMKDLLGEFEARTRCGLINLGALVDTLVMLNLLPPAAAESPLSAQYVTTLALLRQWCAGTLAVSHAVLKEMSRSQLQSMSPLMDASGNSEMTGSENEEGDTSDSEWATTTAVRLPATTARASSSSRSRTGQSLSPRISSCKRRGGSAADPRWGKNAWNGAAFEEPSTARGGSHHNHWDRSHHQPSSSSSSGNNFSSRGSPALSTEAQRKRIYYGLSPQGYSSGAARSELESPLPRGWKLHVTSDDDAAQADAVNAPDFWTRPEPGSSGCGPGGTGRRRRCSGDSSVGAEDSRAPPVTELDMARSFWLEPDAEALSAAAAAAAAEGQRGSGGGNEEGDTFNLLYSGFASATATATAAAALAVSTAVSSSAAVLASPERRRRAGSDQLDSATHGGDYQRGEAGEGGILGLSGRGSHSDFDDLAYNQLLVQPPRRQRALYEYVARFRARNSAAVLQHLRVASTGFSLAMRLRGTGGGGGISSGGGIHSPGSSSGLRNSSSSLHNNRSSAVGQVGILRLEPVHHVWTIGDIHADFKENMAWIQELPAHNDDALIVTGNVSSSLPTLARALRRLRKRFKYVFFVFGNQELWAGDYAGDSIDKFFEILDLCDATGIITAPAFLGDSLAVVPLFSWYNIRASSNGSGHAQGLGGGFSSRSSARHGGWSSTTFPGGSYSRARAASATSAASAHNGGSSHSRPRVGGRYPDESLKEPASGRNSRANSYSSSTTANNASQAHRNNNDSQCRWPQAVAEAAISLNPTSSTGGGDGDWSSRPTGRNHHHRSFSPDSNSGGTSSSPQSGSINEQQGSSYYCGNSAFAAAGASAFFHELNREALGVDYGRRRVLSFSHFVPHDRLSLPSSETSTSGASLQETGQAATAVGTKAAAAPSQPFGATTGMSQGSSNIGNGGVSTPSQMPTPLTEELERLNATAHAFGQANGAAVSRVEALEGVCFMQHTLGDYDPTFQSSRFSTGQPQYRDRAAATTPTAGKAATAGPKSASKSGKGKHGSAGTRGSAAASAKKKAAAASPANTRGNTAQAVKSATKAAPESRSKNSPASEADLAALAAEATTSSSNSNNGDIYDSSVDGVSVTPMKAGVPECDRERPVVAAASRRLQLAWDDHYYAELTLTVAHAHADALRRGMPVVKHGRNKVAASRMLFVSVTRHCADGSAAPEQAPLPSTSTGPTSKASTTAVSRQFGTSSGSNDQGDYEAWRLENNGSSSVDSSGRFSGGRSGGVKVKGRSGSPVPSDAGSDSPRAALSAGINHRASGSGGDSSQAGGFTKVWVELGHRGPISALDRRGGGRVATKRFDLAHLRGVCVGRQTDTFQQSSRQPPPSPAPPSNVGSTSSSTSGPPNATAANAAAAAARAIFEPPPGSSDLCLSLIGGEGWGHRSLDLEFKTVAARDAALRFFRHEMRKLECQSGAGLLPPPAAAAAAAARAARAASVIGRRRSTLI